MKSKMRNFQKFTMLFLLLLFVGALLTKPGYAGKKEMRKKVCLVQIGHIDERIMLYVKIVIEGIFNKKIDTISLEHDPYYAYNKRRKQYYSSKILQKLRKLKSSDYESLLAVIDVDLYVPELTFVFGEADLKNRVSIISLTRLRQEFYNLPADLSLFNQRIITEAVHELGHTYGLRHCQYDNCVMFFSRTLSDTDKKGSGFCDLCEKKLEKKRSIKSESRSTALSSFFVPRPAASFSCCIVLLSGAKSCFINILRGVREKVAGNFYPGS